jgi:hypothetical protein
MGQYVAGHIVKSLVLHLFDKYEVHLLKEEKGGDSYNVDKSSWTPKADALLRLTKRQAAVV